MHLFGNINLLKKNLATLKCIMGTLLCTMHTGFNIIAPWDKINIFKFFTKLGLVFFVLKCGNPKVFNPLNWKTWPNWSLVKYKLKLIGKNFLRIYCKTQLKSKRLKTIWLHNYYNKVLNLFLYTWKITPCWIKWI